MGFFFLKLLSCLAAVAALLPLVPARSITGAVHSRGGAPCNGTELRRTIGLLTDMYSISKWLQKRTASEEEVTKWLFLREGLDLELSTSLCKSRNKKFCCQMCVSRKKTIFCSRKALVTESEELLRTRIGKKNESEMGTYTSHRVADEATVDLFAVTCKKPMEEEICSEFVSQMSSRFQRTSPGCSNICFACFSGLQCCDPFMKRKLVSSVESTWNELCCATSNFPRHFRNRLLQRRPRLLLERLSICPLSSEQH